MPFFSEVSARRNKIAARTYQCGRLFSSVFYALLVASVVLILGVNGLAEEPSALPWKVNDPIVTVEKSLFRKRPKGGGAAGYSVSYIGPKLERMEIGCEEVQNDIAEKVQLRISEDNGRTWGPYQPLPEGGVIQYQGVPTTEGSNNWEYDPRSGAILQTRLLQVGMEGRAFAWGGCHNFTTVHFTFDRGKTWSRLRQFHYEPGDDFDVKKILDPSALRPNQGYPGQSFLFHTSGTTIFPLVLANALGDPDNDKRSWKMGAVLMIGKWDPTAKDYHWEAGARVEVTPQFSARGLLEPDLVELPGGPILIVWRANGGHKVFSISLDGGRTLSPIANWNYDDGTPFYSPSSIHRFLRHSVTKKLYWFGNICEKPPQGNEPRYPLVIAEVDETIPALKRKTVTAIDDRQPGQSDKISFSNFCLLEDRETHQLEMYLASYGENPKQPLDADCYRYRLTFTK